MSLISEEYCSLNAKLHEAEPGYGTKGGMWAPVVLEMAESLETKDILDYGSGKGTLANNIPFTIRQYDPAISVKNASPRPADIVVCTDVLEHVEPDKLDSVLDHLQDLTRRAVFLNIATILALKSLEDGRNAHLIVENIEWWLPQIMKRFEIMNIENMGNEFIFAGNPK